MPGTSYKTIKNQASDEFTEQRSRFIGYVRPVSREEEALAFIEEKKKQHWDAKHNVYAYVLRSGVQRYSDDGEPHGTAGVPVLNVLLGEGVTDAAVVVTRYFGGILLGTGGLVRAYTRGAKIALEAGGIVKMESCVRLRIRCDYSMYGKLSGLIPSCGGVVDDTQFGAEVTIDFHMTPVKRPAFEKQLADMSCGAVAAEEIGEGIYETTLNP